MSKTGGGTTRETRRKQQELAKRVKQLEAAIERRNDLARTEEPLPDPVENKVRDLLYWLQHHTQTKDPHWREVGAVSPYRPFPDKPYFQPTIEKLQHERTTFIVKSRNLMLSWLVVAYFTHMCQIHPGTEVLFQSQTEPKAAELVDYAKCLVDRQDDDIRERYPLFAPTSKQNSLELVWRHGSRIIGIPHGADKIRSYHPTALFMDEAAFIPDGDASFNEAIAGCQKIVVLSTANMGWFESVIVSAE